MFFIQPLILIAEFIQSTVLIVLMGVVLVELFICRRGFQIEDSDSLKITVHDYRRYLEYLFVALALFIIGNVSRFVIQTETWQLFIFWHLPILILALTLLWLVAQHSVIAVQVAYLILLILTLIYFTLAISEFAFLLKAVPLSFVGALLSIIGSVMLYFMVMQYLIHQREL